MSLYYELPIPFKRVVKDIRTNKIKGIILAKNIKGTTKKNVPILGGDNFVWLSDGGDTTGIARYGMNTEQFIIETLEEYYRVHIKDEEEMMEEFEE